MRYLLLLLLAAPALAADQPFDESAVRALVKQNQELRDAVIMLDKENDELSDKLRHIVGMVGVCT